MRKAAEELAFVKMEATGNDFVLLDAADGKRKNWGALAKKLCARHFSVGADGLLVIHRHIPRKAKSAGKASFRMRMFNPDGSEDMCGNGLRCVAAYLYHAGYTRSHCFLVQTLSGPRQVTLTVKHGQVESVQTNLGPPRLRGGEIPVTADTEQVIDYPLKVGGHTISVSALSTGTPHAVVFSETLSHLEQLGPPIMAHPFFPSQTTVNFVEAEGKTRLFARTWERGEVGESLSCGTGAAAILAAAHLKGITARQAEIVYPGGILQTRWDCNGDLWVAGPAREVFRGRIKG